MVSNRSRGNSSVGNKLNSLDTRVSRAENSTATSVDTNAVTGDSIAPDSITNDNIAPGSIQSDSVAFHAIGTEHLGIVNRISTDSSLIINVGDPNGYVQINGTQYPVPSSGTVPLSMNGSGQIVPGLDSGVTDTSVSNLIKSITSATRIALERILAAPGDVKMIAAASPNTGWLLCDGTAVSRTTYANLYAAIGSTYGAGDGSTTFNLPNLQGKVPVGRQSGDAAFGNLGATGGERTHTLTVDEMPTHTHTQTSHGHGISDPGHGHGVNDPGHGHGISDPGHGHNVYDGGHSHGVSDGGHSHGSSTLDGFMTYLTNNANRRQLATSSSSGFYGIVGNTIDGINYGRTNGSGANISINGSGANIGIYGNGTGISINGSGTGIGIQGSGTGVSVQGTTALNQNTGGSVAHNVLQPYVVMNYVIRY